MTAKKPKHPIPDADPVSVPFPFDEAIRRALQVKRPPEGFEQEAWRTRQKRAAKGPGRKRKGAA